MTDTMASWLAEATPDEASIRICLNRRLYRQLTEQAKQAVSELERYQAARKDATTLDEAVGDEQMRQAAQRALDAEKALREAEDRELVFRCLPWHEWQALVDAHPPTEQQREASPNNPPDWNEQSFWPAAVAASCVSPGMTVSEAEKLREVLPRGKWQEVCGVVHIVNVGGTGVPKSVSSIVGRLGSALNSTTAAREESPSPSSADESPTPESSTG